MATQKLILCPDTDISPQLTISDRGTCNEMIWEEGSLLDPEQHDFSNLEFLCETLPAGRFPDYAVSDMGCPVVSERLKSLFDSLKIDNVQYLPAGVVERHGQPPKRGYYAANIIGLVDCIDPEASDMDAEYDDNGELSIVYGIDRLVLKDAPSPAPPLYRARLFTRLILLDETLQPHIEGAAIEGVRLVRPERWDGINGEV